MTYTMSLFANFIGLALSVWLGLYILTHNRRSPIAWFSGLTLASIASLFAHILLSAFASPAPVSQPLWLRVIFPIWPMESYDTGIAGWTQGWAICLGVIFWYHTTTLISAERKHLWRLISLVAVYVLGISAMALLAFTSYLFTVERSDPYYVDTLRFNYPYLFFAFFLVLFSGLSVFNLLQTARHTRSAIIKKQLNILIIASMASILAIGVAITGSIPGTSIPSILVSLPLIGAVSFFGYGVVRYSALLEHRILRRDIVYNAVGTGLVILLYLGVFLWLNVAYNIPESIIVFLIPLVIISHSMIEEVRRVLERIIYDHRTREIKVRLHEMSRLVGEQANFDEVISRALEAICLPIRATCGVVMVFENNAARSAGAYRWHSDKNEIPLQKFLAEDVKHLQPGSLGEPFLETTLLVPLYNGEDQTGALVLGRPENGIHYSSEDVQFLLDPCDRIAELILKSKKINDYLDQVIQIPIQGVESNNDLIPPKWVEEALQNLYDYAYLGDSPLVNLKLVCQHLPCSQVTHVDKGKAVYRAVSDAVEKLLPEDDLPSEPVPREWYPYLILYKAYFEGMSNFDIMNKLYISEGTFNRTRRSALRSVARVMTELEAALG